MSFLGARNSISLGIQGMLYADTGTGASGAAGYSVANSLRFRSSASAYLGRTPSVIGSQTTWTWSSWFKRGGLGFEQEFLAGGTNGTVGWNRTYFGILSSDKLFFGNQAANIRVTTQVFRDPSAWYHLTVVFDSSNATDANRVLIYINGTQVTAFDTSASVPISTAGAINSTTTHQIGWISGGGAALFFDGEMAEVNFVDGQALAPTAFGASSIYNQWLPKKYAGTYGTNGFYLPFSATSATSYAGSFNGSSQYLSVPNNAAFSFSTGDFTIEMWVYPQSFAGYNTLIEARSGATASSYGLFIGITTGKIYWYDASGVQLSSSGLALNAWAHVAVSRTSGVLKMFISGVQVYSAANTNAQNPTGNFVIGRNIEVSPIYFNGYISNLRVVKGTAVYTAAFIPPTTALTAITNTSLLTLQNATIVDNSTNAFAITNTGTVVTSVQSPFLNTTVLTADSSGNANNWTPNNISITAGSTYDSLTDVPTLTSTTVANYAVLNPLDKGTGLTLSNANLTYATSGGAAAYMVRATVQIPATGKYYWEATVVSGTPLLAGIATANAGLAKYVGEDVYGWGYFSTNGIVYNNNATLATYSTATTGDVIGFAFSSDAQTFAIYKNNTVMGTLTGFTLSGTYFPAAGSLTSGGNFNFGQQPFTYTPPTGFLPLNTFNIAAGTVTTSGTFTGNLSTDGPFVFLNGTPTAMTINGNAVTFGTQADKLANGFKVRSSSALYNLIGSNTYVATTVGAVFKYEDAQSNP